MTITKKNCKVADKIIEILEDEKCTVEEARDILEAVAREIRRTSTVKRGKTFTEKYYG